jgi:hypothetical protein
MGVLPKLSHHVFTAVLSVLLLFSSNFACWSQLLQPTTPEECCAKNGCKRMPGQPAHSSCRITPASTERLTPPVVSPVPVPQMTRVSVDVALDPLVARFVPENRPADHSPPDLFLSHSSLLI